jgi:hypothetical protein
MGNTVELFSEKDKPLIERVKTFSEYWHNECEKITSLTDSSASIILNQYELQKSYLYLNSNQFEKTPEIIDIEKATDAEVKTTIERAKTKYKEKQIPLKKSVIDTLGKFFESLTELLKKIPH